MRFQAQRPVLLHLVSRFLSVLALSLFTQTAPADNWTSNNLANAYVANAAISADASVIITAGGDHGVYVSTNYGATWVNTPQTITHYGGLVASSADGKKLFVSNGSALFPSSTNSGQDWSFICSNAPYMNSFLVTSADGNVLVGGSDSGLFTSTNGGTAWVTNFTGPSLSAACSADGKILFAALGFPRGLQISTNSGLTWHSNSVPLYGLPSIVCSADGHTIVAGNSSFPPTVVVSTNGGLTWRTNAAPSSYNTSTVTGSADLHTLIYWLHGGLSSIYTSTNLGASWITNSPPNDYYVDAMSSADGQRLLAFQTRGLWASAVTNQPLLTIQKTSDSARLSWIVPSTGQQLEQADAPSSTNWSAMTNNPTLNTSNLNYEVTVPASAGQAFFRLHVTP